MEIVQRGAEAVLCLDKLEGQKVLVKERVKKGYRIPELDSRIRTRRTRREAELLSRARRAGVLTPRVLDAGKDKLIMEWIEGRRVKDCFNQLPKKEQGRVAGLIGETVARLHSAGIIHGDLTTSNMILAEPTHEEGRRLKQGEGSRLFLIDFGLGKFSQKVEDQAVDLYLLYEALRSTHFRHLEQAWANVLNAYKQKYSNSMHILSRIEQIRTRRRYA